MKKWYFGFIGLVLLLCLVVLSGCAVLNGGGSGAVTSNMTLDLSSANTIASAQSMLNAKGYNCGRPDGIYGSNTAGALRRFQHDNGLTVTGKLNVPTAQALGLVPQQQRVEQPVATSTQTQSKGFMARTGNFLRGFSSSLRNFGKGTAFEGGTNLASGIYEGVGKGMEGSDRQSFGETVGSVNQNVIKAVRE